MVRRLRRDIDSSLRVLLSSLRPAFRQGNLLFQRLCPSVPSLWTTEMGETLVADLRDNEIAANMPRAAWSLRDRRLVV
jgi:hypothetical protein